MAEEEETNEAEEAEPAPSGNKKKLIIIIVLVLGLVAISVTGTLLALKFFGPQPVVEETEEVVEEEDPLPSKAIYYPIKPEIIVTYDVRGRRRYMRADITLMTRENDVIAAIEMHMPKIRNALNLIIGGQIYKEIQTAEGKELMRLACLAELQKIMEEEIGKTGIEQVLFTNLVMQ